jgi:hypothetical protein
MLIGKLFFGERKGNLIEWERLILTHKINRSPNLWIRQILLRKGQNVEMSKHGFQAVHVFRGVPSAKFLSLGVLPSFFNRVYTRDKVFLMFWLSFKNLGVP